MKQSRGEEAEAWRLMDEEVWEAVGPPCREQRDPRGGVHVEECESQHPARERRSWAEVSWAPVGHGGQALSHVWGPQGKNFLTRGCLRASWWETYLVVRRRSPLSLG